MRPCPSRSTSRSVSSSSSPIDEGLHEAHGLRKVRRDNASRDEVLPAAMLRHVGDEGVEVSGLVCLEGSPELDRAHAIPLSVHSYVRDRPNLSLRLQTNFSCRSDATRTGPP